MNNLPEDMLLPNGTIKPEAQASILAGSNNANYDPATLEKYKAAMAINDFRLGNSPGSSFNNFTKSQMVQREAGDEYNQKLIERRNKGVSTLMELPASKRVKAYPKLVEILRGQGADMGLPETYDEEALSLMKDKEDNWAEKLALQYKYRLALAEAKRDDEDDYTKQAKREAAKKGITLLSDINTTEKGLPQLKYDLEKAKSLAPEASYTGLEKARDIIASPFFQTKGAEKKSLLETELKSNIIPRIMSIIQDRYTAEEAKQVINNLYKESDSPETKINKIDAFYEKELSGLESKKKQYDELASQTGYTSSKFGIKNKQDTNNKETKKSSNNVLVF